MAGDAMAGEDLAHFRLPLGAALEGCRKPNAFGGPCTPVRATLVEARPHPARL